MLSHHALLQYSAHEHLSQKLSERFSNDIILLCCDGAAWHKSGGLELPENIILFHIPPYTPEMNPIEQIWKEIRKRGFRNEIFATLEKVVDRLRDTICSLFNNVISSITGREWIIEVFNLELVQLTLALQILLEDPESLHAVQKGIYMVIAERFCVNWKTIGRNIRTLSTAA